jgi:hypothetical protein
MFKFKLILLLALYCCTKTADGQAMKLQRGFIFKQNTSLRLGDIAILNKSTGTRSKSNMYGEFSIMASPGDTLEFSSADYSTSRIVINDFQDKIVYVKPVIQLQEIVISENTFKKDLLDAQKGYRKKSVFYTGTPHYFYLFCKPMTFIYENFKSEVIEARRFKRFTKNSLSSYEVAKRWNDTSIKANVPIKDDELDKFETDYWPTLSQVRTWSDYELINYIKNSYMEFEQRKLSANSNL